MKSLAELAAIREKMKDEVAMRENNASIRVSVCMATCGIAAGARPVLGAFAEKVFKEGLAEKVTVTQSGCIGLCKYEPVVEIYENGKDKVVYVNVTADKAAEIVEQHLKNVNIVEKYTIDSCNA